MISELDATAERQALDDLVKSDGWRVFKGLVGLRFGPVAQLQEIDDALKQLEPADVGGQRAVVTQIRVGSHAAETVLTLPLERIRALDQAEAAVKQKAAAITDPFAAKRRGPRRA